MPIHDFFQAIAHAIGNLSDEEVKEVKTGVDEKNDCKAHAYNKLNMIAYDEVKDKNNF